VTATGQNTSVGPTKEGVLHAELVAVAHASRATYNNPTTAMVIHINPNTPEIFQQSRPCRLCTSVLRQAGVKELLYVNFGELIVHRS